MVQLNTTHIPGFSPGPPYKLSVNAFVDKSLNRKIRALAKEHVIALGYKTPSDDMLKRAETYIRDLNTNNNRNY